MTKLYAWQENEKWCLSRFKKVEGRPRNIYDTQSDVVTEANKRRSVGNQVEIEWLD